MFCAPGQPLTGIDAANPGPDAASWERVLRKLQRGAKLDAKDGTGRMPLQIASRAAVEKDQVVALLTELTKPGTQAAR